MVCPYQLDGSQYLVREQCIQYDERLKIKKGKKRARMLRHIYGKNQPRKDC